MILIDDVSKSYGPNEVLHGVSFECPDGMVTGFVGPNGAGKSTLLRTIAGLTPPDRGRVTVDGEDRAHSPHPGRALGVLLSAEWIPERLTGTSFLEYLCDLQGLSRDRVDAVLEQVGLSGVERRRIAAFSLGMRQRLGIAGALLAQPRNLVLDEPVNGLDPDGVQWLRGLLMGVARDGGSVLLSSHLMSELALVADRVVMISRGRVVRQGDLADFVSAPQARTYLESKDLGRVMSVLRAEGLEHEPSGHGITVHHPDPSHVGAVVFGAGGSVSHLSRTTRSLEETYFDLITSTDGSTEP